MQEKYWKYMVQIKAWIFYLDVYTEDSYRWDRIINIVVAIASSTSIAAWAIWQKYSFVWSIIIAISQVLTTIKGFLPYSKRLKMLVPFMEDLKFLYNKIEYNWFKVASGDLSEDEINELLYSFKDEFSNIENKNLKEETLLEKDNFRKIAKNAITSNLSSDNIITTAANSEYVSNKTSLSDNKAADITGVDLMIQAGYNPLAMIVVVTKMPGSTLEILQGKPANSERAMNIYDYLTYNYPSKVKAGYGCQEYRAFLTYADPIVADRNSNKKKLDKFNKEQAKNKALRAKNIAQYKATGGLSGWDASYTILKTLTESSEK